MPRTRPTARNAGDTTTPRATGAPISAGSPAPVPARRERKKAATRAAIADAALRLFQRNGFDAVSLKHIAEEADVAVATIFKHFPSKEALVFDEDPELERALVAAVTDRLAGRSVLESLERFALGTRAISARDDPAFGDFLALVRSTPALDAYWRQTWIRHSAALAAALRDAARGRSWELSEAAAHSLARSVLDAVDIARHGADPAADVAEIFALLRSGWPH